MFEPSASVLSGHLGPRVSPPACLQPICQIHAIYPSLHVAPSHVLTICPQSPCVPLHHDPRNQHHTSQSYGTPAPHPCGPTAANFCDNSTLLLADDTNVFTVGK